MNDLIFICTSLLIIIFVVFKDLKKKKSTVTVEDVALFETKSVKKGLIPKIIIISMLISVTLFSLLYPRKIEKELIENISSKNWIESEKKLKILKNYFFWRDNIQDLEIDLFLEIFGDKLTDTSYDDTEVYANGYGINWVHNDHDKKIKSLDSLKNQFELDEERLDKINFNTVILYYDLLLKNNILHFDGNKVGDNFKVCASCMYGSGPKGRMEKHEKALKGLYLSLEKVKESNLGLYNDINGKFFGNVNSLISYINDDSENLAEVYKLLYKNRFFGKCNSFDCQNEEIKEYFNLLTSMDKKNILNFKDKYLSDRLFAKIYIHQENVSDYETILFDKRGLDALFGKPKKATKNQIKTLMNKIDMYNPIEFTSDNLKSSMEHIWFKYRLYYDNNQKTKALKVLYEFLELIQQYVREMSNTLVTVYIYEGQEFNYTTIQEWANEVNISVEDFITKYDKIKTKEKFYVPNEFYEYQSLIWESIHDIREEKKDMSGALEAIKKAISFQEKLDKTSSGDTNSSVSSPLSRLLEQSFINKWNIRPYGNKKGACADLKRAADINVEDYYDYYIKNCN